MRECQGSTLKLMVWGCVAYFGMGTLAFINGNMNSEKYINTFDNYLWPTVTKTLWCQFLDIPRGQCPHP